MVQKTGWYWEPLPSPGRKPGKKEQPQTTGALQEVTQHPQKPVRKVPQLLRARKRGRDLTCGFLAEGFFGGSDRVTDLQGVKQPIIGVLTLIFYLARQMVIRDC